MKKTKAITDELSEAPGTNPVTEPAEPEYTHEVMQTMRQLGLPKPNTVDQAAWDAATPAPQGVRSIRHALVKDLIANPVGAGDKSPYAQIFAYALDTMIDIMSDPNQSGRTRLQAATYIADQHSGKADQHIHHTGDIQVELRQAAAELEARYQTLAIDSTTTRQLDSAVAVVDAFLESNVGNDFSVGKRGTSGEESESQS